MIYVWQVQRVDGYSQSFNVDESDSEDLTYLLRRLIEVMHWNEKAGQDIVKLRRVPLR